MEEPERRQIDWVHLPIGIEETSMWVCLHDGELKSCRSNLLDSSVELNFFVKHLINEEAKKESVSFLIKIDGVNSVRAVGHFLPLDKSAESTDLNREDGQQRNAEYYRNWREESLNWREVEAALLTDPLQIMDARLVSDGDQATLRLGGFLDGEKFHDIYTDVFIRGKGLSVSRSDGIDFSFDAFLELGKLYWESFGD
jgi:hypothetical protein